jgi:FkbM family methyltransferase
MVRLVMGRYVRIVVNGSVFFVAHCNLDEFQAARRFVGFEPEFLAVFARYAKSAPVVYDIGAHIGLYSLAAACCNPDARIYCFEPQEIHCKALIRSADTNQFGSIQVFPTALGDKVGSRVALVRSGQTARVTALTAGEAVGADTSATTLDALVAEHCLPGPRVVKIDVEGYEAHVVRGMQGVLSAHRPIVLLELHPELLRYHGESAETVDSLMSEHGYEKQILRTPAAGKPGVHSQIHVAYFPLESIPPDA